MIKEMQEEIANDIFENYKLITGLSCEQIVNKEEGEFYPLKIYNTFPKLERFCKRKYGITDLAQEEEMLTKLDNLILEKVLTRRGC